MLPTSLTALDELANNLWWSWNADAVRLWSRMDPWRWPRLRHNPIALLQDLEEERLAELAEDADFMAHYERVMRTFRTYLSTEGWTATAHPELADRTIAYFSMEFGLHESVRIYSGGLGVLAGDHLRSASDLDVPLIGVGLWYRNGYFRQVIDDGVQIAAYPESSPARMPLTQVKSQTGAPLMVEVPIEDRTVTAQIWQLAVGRTRLFLLDTDHDGNTDADRALCHSLYGGDEHTRICQEVLLGVGGVRALEAMNLSPTLYHLNEGHCAFIVLELQRMRRKAGASEADALSWIRERCVFTTHTPVPAGHDRFPAELVETTMGPWRDAQELPAGTFMDLGRVTPGKASETLCMTVLALKGASKVNGVSELHGAVSREMWHELWPDRAVDDVPIGHVTNGVHPIFWMAPASRAFFDEHAPGWRDCPWDEEVWAPIADVADEKIWSLRNQLRGDLVELVAERTGKQLDPNALTIGFARRFAPYKRGDLIFTEPERLHALLERGVQIIYSGKAHPRDTNGQAIVKRVLEWAYKRGYRDRIVFLEDYDMVVGRALTSGSDVWLNNPRRPKEASGTSGQKVPLNGGINLSCRDGWWPEAYDGTNGWAIGTSDEHASIEAHDAFDTESLYSLLEQSVLPEWESRSEGLPKAWIARAKRSIITCAPAFTSHRMVRDYVADVYAPLVRAL